MRTPPARRTAIAHDTPLITTIVAGFVLAFILGALANRLRLPTLVGYLCAGILVGPHTPGFVADQHAAPQLAEIGVILLMFGVGLHFSLKDLMSVRLIAVPGAIAQIAVTALLGLLFGWGMGWTTGGGLVFGLALSVASTVVLLRALQDRHILDTDRGRIAVGWLIVEDLAMVLTLVLIPAAVSIGTGDSATPDPLAVAIGRMVGVDFGLSGIILVTLLKVAAFVGLMLVVGRRVIPWVLHSIAHSGNRELFRLGVLAIALGVAYGAAMLFGVSLALGAFFAGMILAESELSHRAAQESLPLRDAFAVLFFVSVGMLFDPAIILERPLPLLATLAIILLCKSVVAFALVRSFRRSLGTALTIAASLAQVGEFSFILADLGVSLHLMTDEARNLILAGAIVSILLNPAMFWLADRLKTRLELPADPAPPAPLPEDEGEQPTMLTGHTVIIGYGRVGSLVAAGLRAAGTPVFVIDASDARIDALRAAGGEGAVGAATSDHSLARANIAAAHSLVVAIPETFEAGTAMEKARRQNPALRVIGRAHSDAEVDHLKTLGADTVIMGEREIAKAMLARLGGVEPAPE